MMKKEFRKDLERLINNHSIDTETDVPDYILSNFICNAIENYILTKKDTERWHK